MICSCGGSDSCGCSGSQSTASAPVMSSNAGCGGAGVPSEAHGGHGLPEDARRLFFGPRIAAKSSTSMLLPPDEMSCGVGAPPSDRLVASGALRPVTESWKSDRELLFPGFSIVVPKDGNFTPALEDALLGLHQRRPQLLVPVANERGPLLRPTRPQRCVDLRAALGAGGARRSAQRRATEPQEEAASDPLTQDHRGPCTDLGQMRFDYRDQSFCISTRWFANYLIQSSLEGMGGWGASIDTELVSDPDDALDFLLGELRSDTRFDRTDYRERLGCYNLPSDDWYTRGFPTFFWRRSWGPPYAIFELMCQIISEYADFADTSDVRIDRSGYYQKCDGFPEFLRQVLRRERVQNFWGSTCGVSINFENDDEHARVNTPDCARGDRCTGDSFCVGPLWNDYSFLWDAQAKIFTAGTLTNSPESGCNPYARTSTASVFLQPVWLGFFGQYGDRVFFLARMCLDWALAESARPLSDLLTSQRIARYVLSSLMPLLNNFVHELGHVWGATLHCGNDWNCCFDIAAEVFRWRVTARLGLAPSPFNAYLLGDYGGQRYAKSYDCSNCSTDDDETQYWPFYGIIPEAGVPGSEPTLFVRHCWRSDESSPC